jgi:hypothetical protein
MWIVPLASHNFSNDSSREAKHGHAADEELVALGETERKGNGRILAQADLELLGRRITAGALVGNNFALA